MAVIVLDLAKLLLAAVAAQHQTQMDSQAVLAVALAGVVVQGIQAVLDHLGKALLAATLVRHHHRD